MEKFETARDASRKSVLTEKAAYIRTALIHRESIRRYIRPCELENRSSSCDHDTWTYNILESIDSRTDART